MQRKWMLLLTAINLVLAIGLIVWALTAKRTGSGYRAPEIRTPEPTEAVSIETLRKNLERAATPDEKMRAVRALPSGPEAVGAVEAILSETCKNICGKETAPPHRGTPPIRAGGEFKRANTASVALEDCWTLESLQLQQVALEKYVASVDSRDAALKLAGERVSGDFPIPIRDHALRVAVNAVAQTSESEVNGETAENHRLHQELHRLLDLASNKHNSSLPGTALLGASFLLQKNAGDVTREMVLERVQATLNGDQAIEHTLLCALQVIGDRGLRELTPLASARINVAESDAVLLRAIGAVGIVGGQEAARRLEAFHVQTPKQFYAVKQALARIRERQQAD